MRVLETEEDAKGDGRPCYHARMDLKHCVLESDCVKKDGMRPQECLRRAHELLPNECVQFKNLLTNCKRSLIDNRRRFRGRIE
ncbi:cytochrome c oxidase assembly factor 5 [Tetranychus urticae]|uniref:Cytochrome c oxidase assembly factor 5 n=1 Tax=Tetranychus urticae TaxID=32264 RepID=T1KDJ6_TETUR|nr:cytochrome c oxidase assembly factor 5 [Tetranychus urticae]